MKLQMKIHNIKSIRNLEINLPIEKGLYAITGQNGSGKSTLVTCASSVFFMMRMNDYFGKTENDASIDFKLGEGIRSWRKDTTKDKWVQSSNGKMNIKGFYEGSIIFGNRFKNTSYDLLRQLDRVDDSMLKASSEFIRENLGIILHNNKDFYEKLFQLESSEIEDKEVNFKGSVFYYQKGDRRVSQFHMSTGENLLISVLNSINLRNEDRASLAKPCLFFLDEIELALHPSSLKRLMVFLKDMSNRYNYAIYFSTHSIELISSIAPENIFFLERHADNSIEILNPCYPAYATRILYDYHSGYDYIILVEDDLAKDIIVKLLRKNALLSNKLVHVLPCGGYTNVIDLAQEVVRSNLVGRPSSISIVLDGDVEDKANRYMTNNGITNNIPLSFLPIESLEKYLKTNLCDSVDHGLFRLLNDYIFHQKSLTQIVDEYRNSDASKNDDSGKKLYNLIDTELRARNKNRIELIEMVVNYLLENNPDRVTRITTFLRRKIT